MLVWITGKNINLRSLGSLDMEHLNARFVDYCNDRDWSTIPQWRGFHSRIWGLALLKFKPAPSHHIDPSLIRQTTEERIQSVSFIHDKQCADLLLLLLY